MLFLPRHYSKSSFLLAVFIVATVYSIAHALDNTICNANESQPCLCPGNEDAFGVQFCLADASGWTECEPCLWYKEWCDDDTGLCWQDPPKDANVQSKHGGVTVHDAMRYCDELAFGGHNNWRLPTLDELRSIIRDAGITELTCPIREGSSLGDMSMLDVILCAGRLGSFECAGSNGCCWHESLSGTCDTIDPASTTHYLEYWSSTPAVDDPENWFGFVFFDTGTVGFNHALSFGEVRCVRDTNDNNPRPSSIQQSETAAASTTTVATSKSKGIASAASLEDTAMCDTPMERCITGETRECACAIGRNGLLAIMAEGVQKCVDDTSASPRQKCFGHCQCSSFQESPEPVDVCSQCDEVTVTVRVPTRLRKQPYMLAVFLYQYGTLDFRPPDVGVQENEIRFPDIDVDKPVTMTIPGCSYYRDRCMEGEYYLSVYLKMNEGRFPGVPEPFEDYVYTDGKTEPALVLGSNQQYNLDVMVEPFIMSTIPFI